MAANYTGDFVNIDISFINNSSKFRKKAFINCMQ